MSTYFLLAKIGFDTSENEPCKVCRKVAAAGGITRTKYNQHRKSRSTLWLPRGEGGVAVESAIVISLNAGSSNKLD